MAVSEMLADAHRNIIKRLLRTVSARACSPSLVVLEGILWGKLKEKDREWSVLGSYGKK